MTTPEITREDLWKQYEILVDLYKHYLKLAIEINVFYYAITGAIISYCLSHKADVFVRFALGLPILISIMLCIFFTYGAAINRITRLEMFRLRDSLGLMVAPEFAVLSWILIISVALMAIVAITLSGVVLGFLSVS